MEPEAIAQLLGQFGGLGIFAYFVWRTLDASLKNIVAALTKIGEGLEKNSVAMATMSERISGIDRMLDSQRTKRVDTQNGI